MKTYPYPKTFRLLKRPEYRRVYDQGYALDARTLALFYRRGEDADRPARLGITVTKHFGGAVQRNRMKRVLREAFRVAHPRLANGVEVVVNVRRAARDVPASVVRADFLNLLARAGLFHDNPDGPPSAADPV